MYHHGRFSFSMMKIRAREDQLHGYTTSDVFKVHVSTPSMHITRSDSYTPRIVSICIKLAAAALLEYFDCLLTHSPTSQPAIGGGKFGESSTTGIHKSAHKHTSLTFKIFGWLRQISCIYAYIDTIDYVVYSINDAYHYPTYEIHRMRN